MNVSFTQMAGTQMAGQILSAIEPVLRRQQITESEPGPVVGDFENFLDFIASGNVFASGKHDLLPMDALADLNARMARPLVIRLKRPMQKSYPNLQGLYLMARATGLLRTERVKAGAMFVLDRAAMASWTDLNPTERYFALLEAWWLRASMEIVGERGGGGAGLQTDVLMRCHNLPNEGLKIDKKQADRLPFWGLQNIALLEMFGLIAVEHGEPPEGKGWAISEIKRTEFGHALTLGIWMGFPADRVLDIVFGSGREAEQKTGERIVFDAYRKLMAPYFPEWQNSLTLPPSQAYRDGVFTFKVSLGKQLWRRIAIPAHLTLAALNDEIQHAFRFDNDHLHCFKYKDRFGQLVWVKHCDMDEPPYSDQVRIGETPLRPGETMEYLFDFGDRWEFDVLLQAIAPPNPETTKPQIIESRGPSPKQYG